MSWKSCLLAIQVDLQMLRALDESCALISEPSFELALLHVPPTGVSAGQI